MNWENELMKRAEQRISNALQKAFPDEALAAALDAYCKADYDRAIELELRQPWEGANYLIQKIKTTLQP